MSGRTQKKKRTTMRVEVTAVVWKEDAGPREIFPYKKGEIFELKAGKTAFCCDQMKASWDDHFVGFGEYEYDSLTTESAVNIYKCAPYPEGACWEEVAIKYCPWCKAEIEIERTKEVTTT